MNGVRSQVQLTVDLASLVAPQARQPDKTAANPDCPYADASRTLHCLAEVRFQCESASRTCVDGDGDDERPENYQPPICACLTSSLLKCGGSGGYGEADHENAGPAALNQRVARYVQNRWAVDIWQERANDRDDRPEEGDHEPNRDVAALRRWRQGRSLVRPVLTIPIALGLGLLGVRYQPAVGVCGGSVIRQ